MAVEFKADSSELGDSLNLYTGLEVIKAESAEDLAAILKSIKFPFTIVHIGNNATMTRFYAFINSTRKITVKKKAK